MGRDKALLPHPAGGTWLEHGLRLLAELRAPITLLSRHDSHLQLARHLNRTWAAGRIVRPAGTSIAASGTAAPALGSPSTDPQAGALPGPIQAIAEPPPWQGPLLALHRLM